MAWRTDPRTVGATAVPMAIGAAAAALLLGLDAVGWMRTGVWRSTSLGDALGQMNLISSPAAGGLAHAVYGAPCWLLVLGGALLLSAILRLMS